MIIGGATKEMSTYLRSNCEILVSPIEAAFEAAVVGCTMEVQFFKTLVAELKERLEKIDLLTFAFTCRSAVVHQKPIVETEKFRCELADLLLVVKYHPMEEEVEAKSVLYQAKMSDKSSSRCKIDQNQLELLRTWPSFSFGRKRDGGPRSYSIDPVTTEFGSYMLEPRGVEIPDDDEEVGLSPWQMDLPLEFGFVSRDWGRSFGLCPTAWDILWAGPHSVELYKEPYLVPDVDAVLGQICFSRGEHHSNKAVSELVETLYRYVGLAPDPPKEFDGYTIESREEGFAVLEINVVQKGSSYEAGVRKEEAAQSAKSIKSPNPRGASVQTARRSSR